MVVIPTGAEKDRILAETLRDLEAKRIAIAGKSAIQIGDFEVNMADVYARIDRLRRLHLDPGL